MLASTSSDGRVDRAKWAVFVFVFAVAIGWALATNHVWEDYYITYRSSRNLATGHGLVFNHGERLHTFTSPLGVLLPAAASVVTGNGSDAAAIWVFRIWSALAFAGAAVLLLRLGRRLAFGGWVPLALVLLVALDAKSLDFSTNGMETGLLLLFLAWALNEMLAPAADTKFWRLGLAWAGLMWTRPDSFLYIGLLGVAVLLFNDAARSGLTRVQWLRRFVLAGVVCSLVYLPWIVWATWYYGSAVPHTVVAKGNLADEAKTALGVIKTFASFPWAVWSGSTALESSFLPSYYQIGGWPAPVVAVARFVALVLAFQWVWPLWRWEVRVASFTFCGLQVYLSYFPFFPFPWYLPGPAALAMVTIVGTAAQVPALSASPIAGRRRWPAVAVSALLAALLAGEGWLTWQMMRQMKVEQTLSANAVRKATGLWLKEHARPGDTVFMEPLGHIAYFSEMKTLDFPGLSSREVVRAMKAVGRDWGRLIEYLSPDWLVLRPAEIEKIRRSIPRVVNETYQFAMEFNSLPLVQQQAVYGRAYVEHDSRWVVFRRVKPKRHRVDLADPAVHANPPFATGYDVDGTFCDMLHATGLISIKVPAGAGRVRTSFGLPRRTYEGTPVSDGVRFTLRFFDGRHSTILATRFLDPAKVPGDRGLHPLDFALPPNGGEEREIILETECGATDPMDWGCWTRLKFEP